MKKVLLVASLLAVGVTAQAGEYDFDNKYVSASLSSTTYDVEGTDSPMGYRLAVGIPYITDNLNTAVEFGYADLGEAKTKFIGYEGSLSATAFFAVSRFNMNINDKAQGYVKLGFNSIEATAELAGFSDSTRELKLTYSVGAEYSVMPKLALSADFTSYASDISGIAVNGSFKF